MKYPQNGLIVWFCSLYDSLASWLKLSEYDLVNDGFWNTLKVFLKVKPRTKQVFLAKVTIIKIKIIKCSFSSTYQTYFFNGCIQFIFVMLIQYSFFNIMAGPFLAVYCVRWSDKITCPFWKYFQVKYIFAQIFKYFVLFCPFKTFLCLFSPFFWKITRMPLLSRIGPE